MTNREKILSLIGDKMVENIDRALGVKDETI